MTREEIQSMIDESIERAFLRLPEIIGNIMTNHTSAMKMNREFYTKHPEFKDHTDTVRSVIEELEGKNPGIGYDEILKKAPAMIKERVSTIKSLNLKSTAKPSTIFNGEL